MKEINYNNKKNKQTTNKQTDSYIKQWNLESKYYYTDRQDSKNTAGVLKYYKRSL
jgi:hypothetical protein